MTAHIIYELKRELDKLGFKHDERGSGAPANEYERVFYRIETLGPRYNQIASNPGAYPVYAVLLIVRASKERLAAEKRLDEAWQAAYPMLTQYAYGQLETESLTTPDRDLIALEMTFAARDHLVRTRA